MTENNYKLDGARDFDFFYGRWHVHNRRLTKRLQGCTEWEQFEASQECVSLPGGLGNTDHMQNDEGKTVGWSLRFYNPITHRWSIYWVGGRDYALLPPVHGAFANGIGQFEGADEFEGKPILVKFLWTKMDTATPHWEQAFSVDGGNTWEKNWEMDFVKNGHS